jgi:hypothetical protein
MRISSELSSPEESTSEGASAAHTDSFDISAFSLVRNFVEQVVVTGGGASSVDVCSRAALIDWDVVGNSVARSASFEQAIGRAILIADQMSRGVFQDESPPEVFPSSLQDSEPFFAFSVGNAIPDFGDESRYRTRMARRMGGVLKRKKHMGTTGMCVLALFLFGLQQVASLHP